MVDEEAGLSRIHNRIIRRHPQVRSQQSKPTRPRLMRSDDNSAKQEIAILNGFMIF
jgi:hypothetical protein